MSDDAKTLTPPAERLLRDAERAVARAEDAYVRACLGGNAWARQQADHELTEARRRLKLTRTAAEQAR